jgi:hypothetical protein
MVLYLEKVGNVGSVVRWVYMIFLFGLGIYMAYEYYTVTKKMKSEVSDDVKAEAPLEEETSPLSNKLRSLKIPPMVSLPVSGVPGISFWILFGLFALTGFLSGFMGVGGGFILLPALIYLIGCPTTVAVGTSLLSVCFMSGYGCFTYSLSGRTELVAAVIMLFGAAIGAQIGAMATRLVRGYGIRLLFSIMIIFAGVSVALKQAESSLGYSIFGTLAAYCVLMAAGGMTALIFIKLVMGYRSKGAT